MKNSPRRTLTLVVTYLISLGFLVWSLKGIDVESFADEVTNMHWGWVLAAVAADVFVYIWQGFRWSLVLRPVQFIELWHSVRAIYVGLFCNEILPLRTGEIVRCYLLTRWSKLPFTVTLSSALIERIFDGIWLIICLYVTLFFFRLPSKVMDWASVLLVIVLVAAAFVGAGMFYRQATKAAFSRNRFLRKLTILIEDLHIIGHSRYLYFAALASLPYLLLQAIPVYAAAQGYGVDLTVPQAVMVTLIIRLGSAVPQAPGNLGIFQGLTILALSLLGVDKPLAQRFAFVLWGVVTLPLLLGGTVALAVTGMRMADLQKHAHSHMQPVSTTQSKT